MPSLPPASHVVRFDFHFTKGQDTNLQFRKFIQYTGALSQADAQTWADSVKTNFVTDMIGSLDTQTVFVLCTITDLSSSSAPQALSSAASTGTNAGAQLPAGVAVVIKDKIARRYRGGHPKCYLPPPPVTSLTSSGLWTAGYLSGVLGQWNIFVGHMLTTVPVAAAPATEVNVSYFLGSSVVTNPITHRARNVPTPRGTPVVDTILSHSVNPVPASQRRRNETP